MTGVYSGCHPAITALIATFSAVMYTARWVMNAIWRSGSSLAASSIALTRASVGGMTGRPSDQPRVNASSTASASSRAVIRFDVRAVAIVPPQVIAGHASTADMSTQPRVRLDPHRTRALFLARPGVHPHRRRGPRMQCFRCVHETSDGARCCGECGTRLELACPACATLNPPSNKFCQQCGGTLAAGDARFASPETYTPSHLARKILTARTSLAGERKTVTVLFADLKGSLELLVDRDPEDARALLDAVIERLMEAVHRFEGTVNQVMGDGIMALFGAPVAHEDHAVRACYAALRMQRAVAQYADEVRARQGVDVQIRVGINSGEVVVRSVGSDLNVEYTAVGQTTHLAARMEQLARPGTTMITEATRRLADRYVEVVAHGPGPITGLKQPVEVWELRGAAPASRLQSSANALTRFLGREDELARLEALLDRVTARAGP